MDALLDAGTDDLSLETTPTVPIVGDTGGEEFQGQSEQPPEPDFGSYDGRKFSPEINRALKALRDGNPDYAKPLQAVRDGYGRMLAIQQLAPNGIKDIQQWKSAVDALGGAESVSEVLARINRADELEAKLKQGDASVFDADDYKGGMPQIVAAGVERMAKEDPEKFGEMVAPHFATRLASTGLGDYIRSMYNQAGDNEPLKQGLAELYSWFTRNSQSTPAMLGAGKPGPQDEVTKLRQQLQEVQQTTAQKEQERAWNDGVITPVTTYQDEAIKTAIAPYVAAMKLSPERQARFVTSIKATINQRTSAEADPEFARTIAAYRQAKSLKSDGAVTYVKGKIDEILSGIVQEEADYISGGMKLPGNGGNGSRQIPPAAQVLPTGGAGVPMRVAEQPNTSAIDYRRTTDDDLFSNRAWTKDGKYVQWPSKRQVAN